LIDFVDGWPVPAPSPPEPECEWAPKIIPSELLTVADLPSTDAPEDAYHRFALSFNGYEEMGSVRRCGRIANGSIERWRSDGQLPQMIDELRACLFFEQRRWHHFGFGFDDETMAYLQQVVAKLRKCLQESALEDDTPSG
jgi:hypothetical protein